MIIAHISNVHTTRFAVVVAWMLVLTLPKNESRNKNGNNN